MESFFTLRVNGKTHEVSTDPERPLLDVLREDLALTGPKYGCGEGHCRACTVLVDGNPVTSCFTPVKHAAGREILTIEGLASATEILHPVQEAFIEKQALQCGYCVPGMILTAVAFLKNRTRPTLTEVADCFSGNVCRCCNYPNILAAVELAAAKLRGESPQPERSLQPSRSANARSDEPRGWGPRGTQGRPSRRRVADSPEPERRASAASPGASRAAAFVRSEASLEQMRAVGVGPRGIE